MLGRMVQMSQDKFRVLRLSEVTHQGGFFQRKWHLSKSLKGG